MTKVVIGALLGLLAGFASTPANAVRCMDCGTSSEMSCRPVSITTQLANGPVTETNTYCEMMYYDTGSSLYTPSTFFDFWDNSYAGGGGWRFYNSGKVYNNPSNPNRANCTSPQNDRWAHAEWEIRAHQLMGNVYKFKAGDVVTVTYDDGGTEKWVVFSTQSTMMLVDIPVHMSRSCQG
ncbi:hypothetical protein LK996_15550 [Lysobacter sp. A6]|uniref:Secreted protein n=1 Tax=Noviluteimonas lactosilytica TaxID=2888523 RepID=A0ABS8JLJ8_9GAMM|nr:hypothetical protein [Lysobacter lactosilyticus]MCC8364487.1 hypothetical protein [Lysobacter lactosilyticus]